MFGKANDNPKMFHKLTRSKFSVQTKRIELKDSEGRVIESVKEICKELKV